MLADDEFLKEHCDSVTPAPPPNYVSASNQTSGMLAAWWIIKKKKESPLRPRIFSTSTQLYFSLSLSRKLSNNFSFKLYFTHNCQHLYTAAKTVVSCAVSSTGRLIQTANTSTYVVTDKRAKFTCKPLFLAVLRTLPETDKNKLVFTYEEVGGLLSCVWKKV